MPDNTRSLHVLYCEDVRLEVTGQISIIGVFNGDITVPSFPVSIPKFCICVEIGTSVDQPFQSLRIEVKSDSGVTLVDQVFPTEILSHQATVAASMNFEGFEEKKFGMRTQFFAAPLVLDGPTVIRSRLITESGEVKGRAVRVTQGQPVFQLNTTT
jgi:hypothetical protein